MSLPPPDYESFKARLRRTMVEEELTVYGLARRLDPVNPKKAERYLYRWLSPGTKRLPHLAQRVALARALGRDPDFFDPKPGAVDMLKVRRAFAVAGFELELAQRRAWCGSDGPHGGWYLTPEQRVLVGA